MITIREGFANPGQATIWREREGVYITAGSNEQRVELEVLGKKSLAWLVENLAAELRGWPKED